MEGTGPEFHSSVLAPAATGPGHLHLHSDKRNNIAQRLGLGSGKVRGAAAVIESKRI